MRRAALVLFVLVLASGVAAGQQGETFPKCTSTSMEQCLDPYRTWATHRYSVGDVIRALLDDPARARQSIDDYMIEMPSLVGAAGKDCIAKQVEVRACLAWINFTNLTDAKDRTADQKYEPAIQTTQEVLREVLGDQADAFFKANEPRSDAAKEFAAILRRSVSLVVTGPLDTVVEVGQGQKKIAGLEGVVFEAIDLDSTLRAMHECFLDLGLAVATAPGAAPGKRIHVDLARYLEERPRLELKVEDGLEVQSFEIGGTNFPDPAKFLKEGGEIVCGVDPGLILRGTNVTIRGTGAIFHDGVAVRVFSAQQRRLELAIPDIRVFYATPDEQDSAQELVDRLKAKGQRAGAPEKVATREVARKELADGGRVGLWADGGALNSVRWVVLTSSLDPAFEFEAPSSVDAIVELLASPTRRLVDRIPCFAFVHAEGLGQVVFETLTPDCALRPFERLGGDVRQQLAALRDDATEIQLNVLGRGEFVTSTVHRFASPLDATSGITNRQLPALLVHLARTADDEAATNLERCSAAFNWFAVIPDRARGSGWSKLSKRLKGCDRRLLETLDYLKWIKGLDAPAAADPESRLGRPDGPRRESRIPIFGLPGGGNTAGEAPRSRP